MSVDDIKAVAVIGAGDMGHGIAEVALIAGYKVYLRDINHEFVERGITRIHQSLEKLVSKGIVPTEHHEKIRAELLVPCVDIKEAVKEVDLVIEAMGLEPADRLKDALAGIRFGENGLIRRADAKTFFTGKDKVFAAGALVNGGASVARCVAEGVEAAVEMDRCLS